MNTPRVTIIVPLYNAQDCVSSIVSYTKQQTFSDFEAFFVDGSSTSTTKEVFFNTVGNDSRFRYLFHENEGAGVARNIGLEHAHGEFIAFFDADDRPHPRLLEQAVACADANNADIVIFQSRQFDEKDSITRTSPDRWDAQAYPPFFDPKVHADTLFEDFRNWPWDKFFRRSFLENMQLHFPALLRIEDLAFTCQALASAHRIALLDEELYTYTVNSGSSSTDTQDTSPLDFYTSCCALKDYLIKHDLFEVYRTTYTTWVGLTCCVNLLELRQAESFIQAYRLLHNEGLSQLHLDLASRNQLASTLDEQDGQYEAIAGHITKADIEYMLCVIEEHTVEQGTFLLMQHNQVMQERRWRRLLDEVYQSNSFKIGNALLTPLHYLRDRKANGR